MTTTHMLLVGAAVLCMVDTLTSTAYTCPVGYTKCRDGMQCVREHYMCDNDWSNKTVCDDGSDEDSDYCAAYTCPAGYTKCRDGKQCVKEDFMCTKTWPVCEDNSDYIDSDYCAAYTCPAGYTKCRDGKECIKESDICNSNTDCVDGSDEDINYCAAFNQGTTGSQWLRTK